MSTYAKRARPPSSWDIQAKFDFYTKRGADAEDCWLWEGSTLAKSGYGRINHRGQTYKAHRLSYMLYYHEDPGDLFVCHACDNPGCVNPAHLWLGSPADNMTDRDKKRRTANGRKIRNTVKLTEDQVREIRRLYSEGEGATALGRKYGVTRTQIHSIVKYRSWAHVDPEDAPTGQQRAKHYKLTEDDVRRIRALWSLREEHPCTQASLGEQFGVGETTIGGVVNRRTWKNI